jgi:hypothetical protein
VCSCYATVSTWSQLRKHNSGKHSRRSRSSSGLQGHSTAVPGQQLSRAGVWIAHKALPCTWRQFSVICITTNASAGSLLTLSRVNFTRRFLAVALRDKHLLSAVHQMCAGLLCSSYLEPCELYKELPSCGMWWLSFDISTPTYLCRFPVTSHLERCELHKELPSCGSSKPRYQRTTRCIGMP